MSGNRVSNQSVLTWTTDKSHVSDSLVPSGYQADDERSFSLSANEEHSNLSNLVAFLNSPITPRNALEVGNAMPLNVFPPTTQEYCLQGQVLGNTEEVGDNGGICFALPVANLLSGEYLSNNDRTKHGDVVEEEDFIRSRMLSTPDKEQSSDKRRRLSFDWSPREKRIISALLCFQRDRISVYGC